MQLDNRNASAAFISNEIWSLVQEAQTIKPRVIMEVINGKYGVVVTYKKTWMAKQKAIADIFGDRDQSYVNLPQYMVALQSANPGTVVEWKTVDTDDPGVKMFKHVFWAFEPSIVGFPHCQPVITIDKINPLIWQ